MAQTTNRLDGRKAQTVAIQTVNTALSVFGGTICIIITNASGCSSYHFKGEIPLENMDFSGLLYPRCYKLFPVPINT